MRLTSGFKARCLCAMIGSLVLCSDVAAGTVEILVDAALDQPSLQTAGEVALHVVSVAGSENSVGMVVYDEVFQRSTELTVADVANVERISQLTASITPSKFSNLAVGMEKGISELSSEGGVLLIFGNNDILLADAAVVAKYRDWLRLLLLPDAARKSIAIILAYPHGSQPSSLVSVIQEYPNNRVISFSNTSDAIEQLSGVLPFALPEGTQLAEVAPIDVLTEQSAIARPVSTTSPEQNQAAAEAVSSNVGQDTPTDADQAPATLPASSEVAAQSTEKDGMNIDLPVLLALIILLVVMVAVITWFLLKRRRNRHELSDSSLPPAAQPAPSRYLAPRQDIATALTNRPAETDAWPKVVRPKTAMAESRLSEHEPQIELDVTAPENPVRSDSTTRITSPNSTAPRKSASLSDSANAFEADEIDELEELRNVTKHKRLTQTEN